MIDCVVVGYHESDSEDDQLTPDLLQDVRELPAPLRVLLRNRLSINSRLRTYLEALSYWRHGPGNHRGRTESSVYSVWELPSLGTYYLVSYLRRRGLAVEFVNSFTYEREKLAGLLAQDPLTVAVTTTFYMYPAPVIDIVRFIRSHNRTTAILVGGPLVDNCCRALDPDSLGRSFDRMGANLYIWESQGEATLHRVVSALKVRRSVDSVPNVFRKSGSSWSFGPRCPESNDLNECSVDWTSFDRADLGKTVSTRTARSCAFQCAFCDYPTRAGPLALADVSTVERELEALAGQGVSRVAFIDDTFNVPMPRFRDLCRMLVRRDFGLEWFSYFRCGNAKEQEVYNLMWDAGCRGVLLGIESGDDRVLKSMDKRATTADYRFGIEQLKKRGIFTHASIVVGFPGECHATIMNTIQFLNETQPDTFTLNHWYYQHSTPIERRAAELGLRGKGFRWSHTTMNSSEALDAADEMFWAVTAPAWMPVNGLDFWGVPYLLGKGMTGDDIVQFLKLAKDVTPMGQGHHGNETLDPAGVPTMEQEATRKLREFCQSLVLAPANYRKS